MRRKWTWLLAAVLLAGLLAGASVLYDHLRRNQPTPEQLARETTGAIDEQMLKTYNIDGILILSSLPFGQGAQYECGRIKLEGLTRLRQPLRRIGNQPQWQPSPGHPSQLSGENCLAGKGIRLNISQGSSVQQPPDSQHSFTGME